MSVNLRLIRASSENQDKSRPFSKKSTTDLSSIVGADPCGRPDCLSQF